MQDTNLTNTTEVISLSGNISRFPVNVLISCILGLFATTCNIIASSFIWRYAKKNNYVIFVLFLCIGNSVCSLVFTLGPLGSRVIQTPYLCVFSAFAYSWGMMFTVIMTFWISLNQYLFVNHLTHKKVLQRPFWTSILTGITVKMYLLLFFIPFVDTDGVQCDTPKVFGQFFFVYFSGICVPFIAFFVATAVLYKKTLITIKKLASAEPQQERRTEVEISENQNEATRGQYENADAFRLEEKFLDKTNVSIASSGIQPGGIELVEMNNDSRSQSESITAGQSDDIDIEEITLDIGNQSGCVSGNKKHMVEIESVIIHSDIMEPGSSTAEQSDDIDIEEITLDIGNQSGRVSGYQTNMVKIESVKIHSDMEPGPVTGCKDIGKRSDVVQQIHWHVRTQRTVLMILIQATIYGKSIIGYMITAYMGYRVIRTLLFFTTCVCLLISPFQFVAKIPEVKIAMMKAFRCKPNVVGVHP